MADLTDEQAHELGRAWLEAGGPLKMGGALIWWHFTVPDNELPPFSPRTWRCFRASDRAAVVAHAAWPDLRDPATRGAALQVVRQRLGNVVAWLEPQDYEAKGASLYAHIGGVQRYWWGPTEAHALVAAIREAP